MVQGWGFPAFSIALTPSDSVPSQKRQPQRRPFGLLPEVSLDCLWNSRMKAGSATQPTTYLYRKQGVQIGSPIRDLVCCHLERRAPISSSKVSFADIFSNLMMIFVDWVSIALQVTFIGQVMRICSCASSFTRTPNMCSA